MTSIPAVYVRGGTSKGLIFHEAHLPPAGDERDRLFLRAMGSPDPYGRQLNGMGGGISSLSKICIVAPSARPDADVDFTFAQVQIAVAKVSYEGNCGNMASAIGPFAVDEGIVQVPFDGLADVRIYNTNTAKLIRSTFAVSRGRSVSSGDYSLHGVAGTGSPIRLDFLDPGGAATGRLLPAGAVATQLAIGPDVIRASLVDAANPVAFVRAADLGLTATESPGELEDPLLLGRLEDLRRQASVRMGIAPGAEAAGQNKMTPFVALVGPPAGYTTLSGEWVDERDIDVTVRFLSSGQPHRALPLTGALCTAVAGAIPGSVVAEAATACSDGRTIAAPVRRIGSPSGPMDVAATVRPGGADAAFDVLYASATRTSRRLFTGLVEL